MLTSSRFNLGKNVEFGTSHLAHPEDTHSVSILVQSHRKVKALGCAHSFSEIADSSEAHLSLARMRGIVHVDEAAQEVLVEGGIRYDELSLFLNENGLALSNLPSLGDITVAGACATATHGSGNCNPILATSIQGVQMVTANGEIREFRRNEMEWNGIAVNLGALGIVTQLRISVIPAFSVRQDIYEDLQFGVAKKSYDEILGSAYSVSLFTDWQEPRFNQAWVKTRWTKECDPYTFQPQSQFWEACRVCGPIHPIKTLSTERCTPQGRWGSSHEILPHFRFQSAPSIVTDLQSEWFISREYATEAVDAIYQLRDKIIPMVQISDIRSIAADDFWLSPCFQRDSIGIHFTWKKDVTGVIALLPIIETCLEPFHARPHWAKLFTMPAKRLQRLYPRLCDFRRLTTEIDPDGKFRNRFLDKTLFET